MVGLVVVIVEVFVGVAKASLLIEVRHVRDEEREDNGVIYSSSSELWLLKASINISSSGEFSLSDKMESNC